MNQVHKKAAAPANAVAMGTARPVHGSRKTGNSPPVRNGNKTPYLDQSGARGYNRRSQKSQAPKVIPASKGKAGNGGAKSTNNRRPIPKPRKLMNVQNLTPVGNLVNLVAPVIRNKSVSSPAISAPIPRRPSAWLRTQSTPALVASPPPVRPRTIFLPAVSPVVVPTAAVPTNIPIPPPNPMAIVPAIPAVNNPVPAPVPAPILVDIEVQVQPEFPRDVIERKSKWYNRLLFNKEKSEFKFSEQQNLKIGQLTKRKQQHFVDRLTVPEHCIIPELYAFLRVQKFSKYENRQMAIDHLEKLARKFWQDEKKVKYSDLTPVELNLHFSTVQKVVDERANKFLLAEEDQEVDRRRRLVSMKKWVTKHTPFFRTNRNF